MQDAVIELLRLSPRFTDDLDEAQLDEAVRLLGSLVTPISEDDAAALVSLLPASGDLAYGVNWTVLHAIEKAPSWPVWRALTDPDNEWQARLVNSLANAGVFPPGETS